MSEDTPSNPPDKKIRRRDALERLIKEIAGVAGTVYLGSETAKKIPKSSPDPRTYKDIPQPEALRATATAIAVKGENTSFVEDNEFSRKFFEEVRRATFMVEIVEELDAGTTGGSIGTGWAAQNNEGKVVLVTTRHHFVNPKNVKTIKIWRPGIDPHKIETMNHKIYVSTTNDQAITVFDMPDVLSQPIEGLPYQDNVIIQDGVDLLTAGFPGEFHSKENIVNKTPIMGNHVKVDRFGFKLAKGEWTAPGTTHYGASGSVAVINQGGKPRAVGMTHSASELIWRDEGQVIGRKNIFYGTNLSINELLRKN